MKHKLTNFLLATALLFSSACSDEDWRGGGSTEEYIEIGEITVNESPESRAHDNSDNWIWVANEKIIVSAYDKDGKFLASGTYRRNMENTAWSSDSPLARVGVTYKVTTTVPTTEEINSQNDAYNYVLSDYLESTSTHFDDKGALTATLAHQTVDVVAVVTKGAGWESDEAFYEGLSGYTATFYADRNYTVKGLAVAGNDESVDYNDNTDAGLAPGKKTYIFRAHIDAEKLAVAYEGSKTALLYLEDASGMKLPGTYTRPDGVENGKRLKVTLTLNAPSPFAARSTEKDASALKSGVAVVEPWLGRAIPSTLWNGSDVTPVTPKDNTYIIITAAELAWVAQNSRTNTFEGKTIQLANDISLGDQPWTPINTFNGTFDGNGYTISGLKVSVTGSEAGLFVTIGEKGIVKNLGVTGESVTSTNDIAGGIAGANNGTIQNCYTSVAVTANSNKDAGGIAGYNYGTIQNCYTTGAVTSEKSNAGGIAGFNAGNDLNPIIQYCYATGAIKGKNAGGIAGYIGNEKIRNCIALNASITGTTIGRIAGKNSDNTLTDNHAALSISGAWAADEKDGAKKNGTDLTAATFTGTGANIGAFTGWTTTNWDFDSNDNLPMVKISNGTLINGQTASKPRGSYLEEPTIKTQEELAAIASNLSGSYKLGGNITLSGNWTLIAGEFKGTLNGCGFVISGLNISVSGDAGLFATIGEGGIVKNLGVINGSVTSTSGNAGGIAVNNSGTIQNCYTSVAVTANASSVYAIAGGIVGNNYGTIQNCYTIGAITSENGRAGGIAGYNGSEGGNTIECCYATGAIKGNNAGGIAGENGDIYTSYGNIENCIALNNSITGTTSVGRIVGIKGHGTFTANHAAPSIPGAWAAADKVAAGKSGADLTAATFIGITADAFSSWSINNWGLYSDNLPTLNGFKADQPVKDVERTPFLEVPVTTITDQKGLADIASNLSGLYKLGGDITLSGDWTPIAGEFKGTLDGCGFVISGLNVSVEQKAGLFETIGKGGTVKNLGVTGGSVTATGTEIYGYAGGIAGYSEGTIQNCYTSVAVTASSMMDGAGGIVGNNAGSILNCYTTGAVTATRGAGIAGGIAGKNTDSSASIQYCYATGTISGVAVGGIVGNNSSKGSISNCIALNTGITGTTIGRIVGVVGSGTLAANYAAPSIPGAWTGKGTDKKNGADLTTGFTGAFTGWTTTDWTFGDNTKLPTLSGFKADQPVKDVERAPFLVVPVTTITTQAELVAIKSNLSGLYKLGRDITLTGWLSPINGFTGTLDGDGYVITLTDATASLFGTINAEGTVKNLGVKGKVESSTVVGGIAKSNLGTIQNCYTSVELICTGEYTSVGGIAGSNSGMIQNCYSTGKITSKEKNQVCGGIAGQNIQGATIQYCYATGTLDGGTNPTAGIASDNTGSVRNCIALNTGGIISSSDNKYRIANSSGSGTLTDNNAALSIPGAWEANDKGTYKKNGADLPSSFGTDRANQGVFAGWKATDWNIETVNLPILQGFKADQPVKDMERAPFLVVPVTTITTQAELVAIKDNLAGSYKLGGNIILTGNWTPLGDNLNRFTGTLDGCGYTISGLNVSMTTTTSIYAGLFGGIDKDGTVKNLGVTGSVTVTTTGLDGFAYAGGIAGLSTGKIMNCYTNVTVDATGSIYTYAGGIVGYFANADPAISNCFATGNCTATGTGTDTAAAGGILGGNNGKGAIISYCFATGTIEAKGATSSKYAGGIAGQSGTIMTGCIALNKGITGASGKTNRIAGKQQYERNYANCYASPTIPGTWSEIGATKRDGADLTSANFITSNDAFNGWVSRDWRLGENWQFEAKDFTNLPTLLTTGLDEDIPLAGQTALARESFLMLIKTKEQLIAFRNAVNETPNDYKGKTIILAADINLGNENWIPIGKAERSSFMGTFDGGGHRISGLTVTLNGSSAQYGGLFGYIGSGGCVKNLGVSGGKVDVTSPEFAYAGGIAAKNIGKIENCYTDITVKVSAIYAHAGGIAGLNGVDSSNSSSISNCYAVGNVASSYYSGGIAGWSVWGSISNCFATGKVDGKNAAGGITTQSSQSVSNCIALNTGGITCTNANGKCRISYENKESYASPFIPGTWNNAAMDGTSLAWNNYMTAVGTWPSASWSNTKNSAKLPILKGFGTNQPAALLRWVSFLPVK